MKAKLLKKIRKHFTYYWNINGFPVLIDHYTQKSIVFDVEYCKKLSKYTDDDVLSKVKVPLEEWALRWMKMHIGYFYGIDLIDHLKYRTSIQYSKIKNRKIENAKTN